jgi:hypothetical protein
MQAHVPAALHENLVKKDFFSSKFFLAEIEIFNK